MYSSATCILFLSNIFLQFILLLYYSIPLYTYGTAYPLSYQWTSFLVFVIMNNTDKNISWMHTQVDKSFHGIEVLNQVQHRPCKGHLEIMELFFVVTGIVRYHWHIVERDASSPEMHKHRLFHQNANSDLLCNNTL